MRTLRPRAVNSLVSGHSIESVGSTNRACSTLTIGLVNVRRQKRVCREWFQIAGYRIPVVPKLSQVRANSFNDCILGTYSVQGSVLGAGMFELQT